MFGAGGESVARAERSISWQRSTNQGLLIGPPTRGAVSAASPFSKILGCRRSGSRPAGSKAGDLIVFTSLGSRLACLAHHHGFRTTRSWKLVDLEQPTTRGNAYSTRR